MLDFNIFFWWIYFYSCIVLGTPVPFGVTPIVVILVVAGVVLITCAVVIIGALRFRAESSKTNTRPNSLAFKEKIKNPLRINTDVFDTDDNNPDLIPCNKGICLHFSCQIY